MLDESKTGRAGWNDPILENVAFSRDSQPESSKFDDKGRYALSADSVWTQLDITDLWRGPTIVGYYSRQGFLVDPRGGHILSHAEIAALECAIASHKLLDDAEITRINAEAKRRREADDDRSWEQRKALLKRKREERAASRVIAAKGGDSAE